MTDTEYNHLPGIRSSDLVRYAEIPAAYHAPKSPPSQAMREGTLLHCMVFEPEQVDARFAVIPDDLEKPTDDQLEAYDAGSTRQQEKTREKCRRWLEFQADCKDREVFTPAQSLLCREQCNAITGHRDAQWQAALSDHGALREHAITWTDSETGVLCKCRVDLIANGFVWDLKRTRNPHPRAFASQSAKLHYHAKAAFYLRGIRASGIPLALPPPMSTEEAIAAQFPQPWCWPVVGAEPPHFTALYQLTGDDLVAGDRAVSAWLKMHAECTAANHWPAYPTAMQQISLPAWKAGADNERLELEINGETFEA